MEKESTSAKKEKTFLKLALSHFEKVFVFKVSAIFLAAL